MDNVEKTEADKVEKAKERLACVRRHVDKDQTAVAMRRQETLKWNGWGYSDSKFEVDPKTFEFSFKGSRYPISNTQLPNFRQWVQSTLGVDLRYKFDAQPSIANCDLPKQVLCRQFVDELKAATVTYSDDGQDRMFRSHGQCLREIFELRESKPKRIPDLVIWPKSHEDVVAVVNLAGKHNVVLIPFGGGTSVSGALLCPINETRMIVSVDTSLMNRLIYVDHQNLTACIEAGITGQDLEWRLNKMDLCTGHEPDSYEFSSLGGWVATRASGMKKNIYGNIEDLVVHIRMVTPQGVVEKNCQVPRMSSGPDIHHFILGSEGTLGIITEVIMKVRPLPQFKAYDSIVFNSFEHGVNFMREVAKQRITPASIRFMDNEQFIFGQALKPEVRSVFKYIGDLFSKLYVTRIKGFDIKTMCVATLLFEGNKEDVTRMQQKVNDIAKSFGGIIAGEENGKRGYMLTFVIAYIRDVALDYGVVAESFETSVAWDRCLNLCRNVKEKIRHELIRHNVSKPALITCRVTQGYDSGACVYFYFAFNTQGEDGRRAIEDPIEVYEQIEEAARDEIIASGGSISHHHGIGKVRKKWLQQTVSDVGIGMMRAIKLYVDPQNIFANGNLMQ